MKTWITLSVVALLPMLLRAPKALSPIRIDARDPSRLVGLFRRYRISSVTGRASDVGKRSDSYTTGSTRATVGVNGQPSSVSTDIDTQVVVTDRFFITDAQGETTSFEGAGFEARVGNGHVASLAWISRGRSRSGRYFLIYDQTTGDGFFNDAAIRKALTFPYPPIYVAILILMILPIPVLIFFVLAEWWQRARFKSTGVRPLVAVMDERAESIPTHDGATVDVATSLKELAALRSSGALSEAEYDLAKARILGPQ